MIGTSFWDYVFIRSCIFFLHLFAPTCAFYCVVVLVIHPLAYRIPVALEIWAVAETFFFLLIYLPRSYILQQSATHPPTRSREKRRELFQLCHESILDPERYLSKWFKGAPIAEIRRDNVKDFFCWAFLNKPSYGLLEDEELEEYTDKMESLLGRNLQPGRGNAIALRLTVDKVKMLHRSLLWYLCVFIVDTITCVYMIFHSFRFHRLSIKRFLTVFPFRPFTLLTTHKTPTKTLSYWHRPHTAKNRLPVLFIHGIGIGLYPYVNFLAQINQARAKTDKDGDIGIIAIEIMPVSFRLTHAALEKDQMCDEIRCILLKHSWEQVVLVSHSYGTVISTHLLQSAMTTNLAGPVLLIDPVCFMLHLPDVAYNFTCRKPARANEHQLHYFASKDLGVAHTLSRHFFWSENILWRRDIDDRRTTVVLSAKDLIVDTEAVGQYLAQHGNRNLDGQAWKHREWKGKGVDILWFDGLDHAQVFDSRQNCEKLVHVIQEYSVKTASGQVEATNN